MGKADILTGFRKEPVREAIAGKRLRENVRQKRLCERASSQPETLFSVDCMLGRKGVREAKTPPFDKLGANGFVVVSD
jgi:hypothetical protein